MYKTKKHIVWIIANCSTAPYFSWFANYFVNQNTGDKLSFICLYPKEPKMITEMRGFGLECHWVKYDYNQRKLALLRATWQLFRLFRKTKPDIVNTHLFDDSLASMVAAWLAKVPQRMTTRGDAGFHYYYAPKWVFFDKLINRLSTKIIAISGENRQFILEKEKASPEKVTLIHHGIPIEQFESSNDLFVEEFRKEHKLNSKFVIGTVARFIEWKGYKTIVKVAKEVVQSIPNACFLLVGSGEQKVEIMELIKQSNLEENFCLPGYIQPENMPSVYGVMNTYLHAAKMEPFGFVIAEALAAGVPVVSTPTGAALDAIQTGINGWLGEYDKPETLAKSIIEVYQQKIQTPWQPAQAAARQHYIVEQMCANYLALYR